MHRLPIVLLALAVALHPSFASINSSFVVDIIRKLHDVYRFETFPIFSIKPKDSLLADLSQKLALECPLPQMHLIDYSPVTQLRYIIDKDTLSIVLTDRTPTDVLKVVSAQLRGMRLSKMLLVFREPQLHKRLSYFLNWLWDSQFPNVLVLFQDEATKQNQIFTINPYPTLMWVNQTNISDPSKLFMESTKDFKHYRIEIAFTEDVPRVFRLRKKNGKDFLVVGKHGNLITLFAKHMNIELICNYQQNLDLEKIRHEFFSKVMELSVHSYSMFELEDIGSSYPLETVRWCIMVPLRSEVPKSEYIIIAFDWATWVVIGIGVVYIGFLMRFIDPPAGNTSKWYFLRSLAMLMYSPNMAERMQYPSALQFTFFGLVFLLGFILSCIYLTYLTSFCTNMVFQAPIDTVDDLIKEHLRVMIIDYELEAIRERSSSIYGEDFLKILYPVSYFEVASRRSNFDSRYAYSIRQDRWNFLDKQQRGLEKVFFRLSKICFGKHYTMFPLQYDSHLQPHLDNFILLVMQAGLDLFWDEEAFRMAVKMKYSKVLVEETVVVQQLRLDYFKYVYAIWSLGIAVSVGCFAVEVLYQKFLTIKKALQRVRELERIM